MSWIYLAIAIVVFIGWREHKLRMREQHRRNELRMAALRLDSYRGEE